MYREGEVRDNLSVVPPDKSHHLLHLVLSLGAFTLGALEHQSDPCSVCWENECLEIRASVRE